MKRLGGNVNAHLGPGRASECVWLSTRENGDGVSHAMASVEGSELVTERGRTYVQSGLRYEKQSGMHVHKDPTRQPLNTNKVDVKVYTSADGNDSIRRITELQDLQISLPCFLHSGVHVDFVLLTRRNQQ